MNCPICGMKSHVALSTDRQHEFRIVNSRICDRGHRFTTSEVPLSFLADKRELDSAINTVERRIARYKRDLQLIADKRPAKIVAKEFGITDARVRQIRASFSDRELAGKFATIASNSERKTS
jgi:hypothetical protein